jgi:hypothetical protein
MEIPGIIIILVIQVSNSNYALANNGCYAFENVRKCLDISGHTEFELIISCRVDNLLKSTWIYPVCSAFSILYNLIRKGRLVHGCPESRFMSQVQAQVSQKMLN